MVPELNFIYSDVYDSHWKKHFELFGVTTYPTKDEIMNRMNEADESWQSQGKTIFESISNQSKLEWKTSLIDCYVVGKARPMSRPLTMPRYIFYQSQDTSLEHWIDALAHELIHNILVQNKWGKFEKLQNFLNSKGELAPKTITHVPVHAIHYLVYKDLFDESRLEFDIQMCKDVLPEYYRSWEIVKEHGAEEIVKLFK